MFKTVEVLVHILSHYHITLLQNTVTRLQYIGCSQRLLPNKW